jgi:alpha-acetolactate decarboxylase
MKNSFLFIIKYFATSTAIFFLLLITTNYQAYLNIVNSYINQSQLEQTKNSLINSVEAVNLITISDNDTKKKTEKNIESKDDSNNLNNSFKIYSNVEEEKPSLDIDITPYENRIIIPKI